MYLINASKLKLEHFTSNFNVPPYAILSHRWEDDEVLFGDIHSWGAKTKRGYSKVVLACKQAMRDGYTHVWIDTCCIDKSSSAELSEAINSMYRWYNNAGVCYTYLCDTISLRDLGKSEWFSRSWTLQELLAPQNLVFYNQHWQSIGSKHELKQVLHNITNIPPGALDGEPLHNFSVAQRMCWASQRFATRVEDRAYSLMGLFDVQMPMLYGEGEKAFIRLQEEIIKTCHDHSIFAWKAKWNYPTGLFASSPREFKDSGRIVPCDPITEPEWYFSTNLGLSIKLSLVPWAMETYVALLDCCSISSDRLQPQKMFGILLRKTSRDWEYTRDHSGVESLVVISGGLLSRLRNAGIFKRVYVPQEPKSVPKRLLYGFQVSDLSEPSVSFDQRVSAISLESASENHQNSEYTIAQGSHGTAGIYMLTCDDDINAQAGRRIVLKMGFDDSFCPLLMLAPPDLTSQGTTMSDSLVPNASREEGSKNEWIQEYSYGSTGKSLDKLSPETQWTKHQQCYIRCDRRRSSTFNLEFLGISIEAKIDWVRDEGSEKTYGWIVTIRPSSSITRELSVATSFLGD